MAKINLHDVITQRPDTQTKVAPAPVKQNEPVEPKGPSGMEIPTILTIDGQEFELERFLNTIPRHTDSKSLQKRNLTIILKQLVEDRLMTSDEVSPKTIPQLEVAERKIRGELAKYANPGQLQVLSKYFSYLKKMIMEFSIPVESDGQYPSDHVYTWLRINKGNIPTVQKFLALPDDSPAKKQFIAILKDRKVVDIDGTLLNSAILGDPATLGGKNVVELMVEVMGYGMNKPAAANTPLFLKTALVSSAAQGLFSSLLSVSPNDVPDDARQEYDEFHESLRDLAETFQKDKAQLAKEFDSFIKNASTPEDAFYNLTGANAAALNTTPLFSKQASMVEEIYDVISEGMEEFLKEKGKNTNPHETKLVKKLMEMGLDPDEAANKIKYRINQEFEKSSKSKSSFWQKIFGAGSVYGVFKHDSWMGTMAMGLSKLQAKPSEVGYFVKVGIVLKMIWKTVTSGFRLVAKLGIAGVVIGGLGYGAYKMFGDKAPDTADSTTAPSTSQKIKLPETPSRPNLVNIFESEIDKAFSK